MKYIATQIDTSNGPLVNTWEEYDHPGIRAWSSEYHGMRVIADDIDHWDMAESLCEEALDYDDAIMSGKWPKDDTYLNVREFIHFMIPVREFTDHEYRLIIGVLRRMFSKFEIIHGAKYYNGPTNEHVCAILSVVNGKHYRIDPFHGYSQGDYIEIAYAEEDYPNNSIGYVAADALGQYDEYDIKDEDGDGYLCEVYHHYGSAPCEDEASQLKDIIGMKPGDTLVIRRIDGGRWEPDYKEEEVVA